MKGVEVSQPPCGIPWVMLIEIQNVQLPNKKANEMQ